MSLTLHGHPLASYCQKVLIALYENDTPFTNHLVDLGDPAARATFQALWPIAKFPVLVDDARQVTVPESTIIIEYLDRHHPGSVRLVPDDGELAWRSRLRDRLFDCYVQTPMQTIIGDRLRPDGQQDPHGVAAARALLAQALGMLDADMASRRWATGETFTLADCSAAPALYYADVVMPLAGRFPNLVAYLERLKQRPSYARVLREAAPYLHMVPRERGA